MQRGDALSSSSIGFLFLSPSREQRVAKIIATDNSTVSFCRRRSRFLSSSARQRFAYLVLSLSI
jgi:hypothetical protein